MPPTSNAKSREPSWISAYLTLAQEVEKLQHAVLSIQAHLAKQAKAPSGRRSRRINWKGLTEALKAFGEVLATPAMQAFLTGLLPLLAGLGRLLLRWLGG